MGRQVLVAEKKQTRTQHFMRAKNTHAQKKINKLLWIENNIGLPGWAHTSTYSLSKRSDLESSRSAQTKQVFSSVWFVGLGVGLSWTVELERSALTIAFHPTCEKKKPPSTLAAPTKNKTKKWVREFKVLPKGQKIHRRIYSSQETPDIPHPQPTK